MESSSLVSFCRRRSRPLGLAGLLKPLEDDSFSPLSVERSGVDSLVPRLLLVIVSLVVIVFFFVGANYFCIYGWSSTVR